MVLTFNEEANLRRTLEPLSWAREILIVDSGSTDGTLRIAQETGRCRMVTRAFDSFARQCNFGLTQVATPWVLSLDADYVCDPGLAAELEKLDASEDCAGYAAAFRYVVLGQPLRASLYPPRTVLYRRDLAAYEDDGHSHRVKVRGATRVLRTMIHHDDRKPFSRWLAAQDRYAAQETEKLMSAAPGSLPWQDRARRLMLVAPLLTAPYCLLWKKLLFDGWAGWYYTGQRVLAELILSLRLLEQRITPGPAEPPTLPPQ